jgi:leader peptidase (prepilin peptidase) / N-methyltransferase
MDAFHITIVCFLFALGACVGSFLNVVVYRMPLGLSVVSPPSACPRCGHKLAAYDNIPIFGWLLLRGRCRYCQAPVSARYPIVELLTAVLFAGHYLLMFHGGWGPYESVLKPDVFGMLQVHNRLLRIENDWPVLVLHLWLIASLLAATLIDFEHYIIPLDLCWIAAAVGLIGHTFFIMPGAPGSLHFSAIIDALTLGAGVGLLCGVVLLRLNILRRSFADEEPLLEKDLAMLPDNQRPDAWPKSKVRKEIRREILFLLIPLTFGAVAVALVMGMPGVNDAWERVSAVPMVSGFLGSLCGAIVGGAVVWIFRVGGSYAFGREAMGLGDVHLMLGVGAIVGPGAATVAFFLAPVAGLVVAVFVFIFKRRREIPFGPYLSLATVGVMLFYTPIYMYLAPGFQGLLWMIESMLTTNPKGLP